MKYQISSDFFWNNINQEYSIYGGVYKVIAIDKGNPIPISRLLDTDIKGILYIGKALSFLDRVIDLKKSTAPDYKSSNHEFGLRYKQHASIKIKFPYDKLFIDFQPSDKPEELERDELKKYYEEYGELPPLNRQGGKIIIETVKYAEEKLPQT